MEYLKLKNIILLSSLFFLPKLALANAVENVAAGGVVALIIGVMFSFWFIWMLIVGLMTIVNILGIILWIWMIIDVAKRDFEKENDKMLWVLVVVLAGWIGALVYYLMIKRKDQEDKKIN